MDETRTTRIHSQLPHSHEQPRAILIRTPGAYVAWAKTLTKAMPPSAVNQDLPNPLKAERGASQGAVLSPTTWLAFFDILLVALSYVKVKENSILFSGLPGKPILAHDSAYMDDPITPSATLNSLQINADIILAFCIIFGVDIALHRLRSFMANWSSTSLFLLDVAVS